jgi:hypothetical protein
VNTVKRENLQLLFLMRGRVVGSHFECHIPIPDVIPMSFMTWEWELLIMELRSAAANWHW